MKQHLDDKAINTFDLLRICLRSFLIQASWSFDRMQSLGFAYALSPALKKLYPDQKEYESRLKIHMDYFNTQPYFASFILGATIRLEQDRATGANTTADIQGLKTALAGPLGALGDSFFWGALKPLSAVVATALLMTGSFWAPLLFLVLYNSGHLSIRIAVLFRGYSSSGNAMDLMKHFPFTIMTKQMKVVSLCVLGGMLGCLPFWLPEFKPTITSSGALLSLAGLSLTLILVALLRNGGSPVKLMLGLAAFCLVLAYAGVI